MQEAGHVRPTRRHLRTRRLAGQEIFQVFAVQVAAVQRVLLLEGFVQADLQFHEGTAVVPARGGVGGRRLGGVLALLGGIAEDAQVVFGVESGDHALEEGGGGLQAGDHALQGAVAQLLRLGEFEGVGLLVEELVEGAVLDGEDGLLQEERQRDLPLALLLGRDLARRLVQGDDLSEAVGGVPEAGAGLDGLKDIQAPGGGVQVALVVQQSQQLQDSLGVLALGAQCLEEVSVESAQKGGVQAHVQHGAQELLLLGGEFVVVGDGMEDLLHALLPFFPREFGPGGGLGGRVAQDIGQVGDGLDAVFGGFAKECL